MIMSEETMLKKYKRYITEMQNIYNNLSYCFKTNKQPNTFSLLHQPYLLHCDVFTSLLFSTSEVQDRSPERYEINISYGTNESNKKGTGAVITLRMRSKDGFFILLTRRDQVRAGLMHSHTEHYKSVVFIHVKKQSATESGEG